ncbi:MAG: peptide-methionine (S)-S-oxide reductase MsrA [Alphaproteobacteria bacterium]
MARAIFAAGCFWGVEASFRRLAGVSSTAAGYIGGDAMNPTYEAVCSGRTGHAEAVMVEFDPAEVSYGKLLETFWDCHDPTQVGGQGLDLGSQYRSAIFPLDEAQSEAAYASRAAAQKTFRRPIATEITPAGDFWMAEDYHQQYLEKQGMVRA